MNEAMMKMFMKTLGVDPEQVTDSIRQFGQMVVTFNAKLDEVKAELAVVNTKLDALIKLDASIEAKMSEKETA